MKANKRLALFDLDHTLLPLDSDYQWADFLARSGYIGDKEAALKKNDDLMDEYNAGTLSADESYAFMLGLLTHGSIEQLNQWHAEFMQKTIIPAIKDIALHLVNRHLLSGDLCAIVTATNDYVTAPIAKEFGIEHLIATTAEIIDNRYTGKVKGTPCFQEGKITKVKKWLSDYGKTFEDYDEIWFYSDSINDLPLLETVTHPVATNPSPALRKIAKERNWIVMDLFNQFQDVKS